MTNAREEWTDWTEMEPPLSTPSEQREDGTEPYTSLATTPILSVLSHGESITGSLQNLDTTLIPVPLPLQACSPFRRHPLKVAAGDAEDLARGGEILRSQAHCGGMNERKRESRTRGRCHAQI